uniref:Uncharacterized protein n=1 Tax=Rhizophora mucronata TaxID=61149 RepID=A0A2P2MZ94_RHIMU
MTTKGNESHHSLKRKSEKLNRASNICPLLKELVCATLWAFSETQCPNPPTKGNQACYVFLLMSILLT